MIEVVSVVVVRPYVLQVEFKNGEVRRVDVESVLWGPMFESLRDPKRFAEARFDSETGTVVWPNGADLAPEFLYEQGEVYRPFAQAS